MAESVTPAPHQGSPAGSGGGVAPTTGRRARFAAWRGQRGGLDLPLLVIALLLVPLTWPLESFELQPGLDPSWRAALQAAAYERLDFGTDVIFSYGPLGFLREPVLVHAWPTRLSFAYLALVQFAFCATLLWALRRNLGSLLPAVPVAFVVVELLVSEPVPVVVFAVAVALAHGDVAPRTVPWLLAALGALSGVQLLAKLNVGIIVVALAAIALAAMPAPRRRAIGAYGGGLVATLVAGWLLTGQSLTAVGGYLRGSQEIISGYSQAMTFESPGDTWQLWVAGGLAALGFALIVRGDRSATSRTRAALSLLWLALAFTAFKEGFVRHDSGHANIFFATMLGGFAVLPLARLPRATTALALLVAAVALFSARGDEAVDDVRPDKQLRAFAEQARILAVPRRTNAHIVAGRERIAAAYALDPASYDRLKGHSVHVEPYDTNATLAYRLEWRPLPIFQSYTAYTPYLDRLNARRYASAAGPQRVLRHAVGALDGRNPAWESPAAMRAMLCNFRALSTTPSWQVLGRVPDRCGPARRIGESRVRFGADVAIPAAPDRRSVVFAVVDGAGLATVERLVTLVYRAQQRTVTLDGTRPFRLVPATAIEGLLLRVPAPLDFPAPFALDQAAARLAIARGAGEQPDGTIRVSWFAMTLR